MRRLVRRLAPSLPPSRMSSAAAAPATAALLSQWVAQINEVVQRDEGKRGLLPHLVERVDGGAQLLRSAQDIVHDVHKLARGGRGRVAVVTGFPCLLQSAVPQETDGPAGAVAIAAACAGLGHDVVLVTDTINAKVLEASAQHAGLGLGAGEGAPGAGGTVTVEAFSPLQDGGWGAVAGAGGAGSGGEGGGESEEELRRLADLWRSVHHVVAIERAGPARDGRYYTASAKDMTHLLAPLDMMLSWLVGERDTGACSAPHGGAHRPRLPSPGAVEGRRCTGIGDGGNEAGMGTDEVHAVVRSHVRNGERNASVCPSHNLVACSVSNWGGYALAGAIALVAAAAASPPSSSSSSSAAPAATSATTESVSRHPPLLSPTFHQEWALALLPSDVQAARAVEGSIVAGARDGLTGGPTVDGLPLEENWRVLREIRAIVAAGVPRLPQ